MIIEEEYDTESLDIDVEMFKKCGTSNIAIELKNDDVVNEILIIYNITFGWWFHGLQMYADHFHLTKYHQNQLKQIKNMLGSNKCELSSCNFANRHLAACATSSNDDDYNLHMEVTDDIHLYIYRLKHSGLRSKKRRKKKTVMIKQR